jgi:hypothetical protein
MKSGTLSAIKSKIVPNESRLRRIPFGLFKGQRLDINLCSQSQLYLGLWERETYNVIWRASQSAEWFVDIGAGRGELCILFASLPNVNRVIAVEPDGLEINGLLANLRHNNIASNRVEVLPKFAGTNSEAGHIEVDQLALDHSAPGFMKIDVDGCELDVLQSGKQLFSKGKVEALVETHSHELEQNCIKWLEGQKYTCSIINNAWWRNLIPEQRPILHNRWLFAARKA